MIWGYHNKSRITFPCNQYLRRTLANLWRPRAPLKLAGTAMSLVPWSADKKGKFWIRMEEYRACMYIFWGLPLNIVTESKWSIYILYIDFCGRNPLNFHYRLLQCCGRTQCLCMYRRIYKSTLGCAFVYLPRAWRAMPSTLLHWYFISVSSKKYFSSCIHGECSIMFDLPVQGTFYLVKNLWNRKQDGKQYRLDDPPLAVARCNLMGVPERICNFPHCCSLYCFGKCIRLKSSEQ